MRLVIDTKGSSGWCGNLNYLRWTAPGINEPPSVQLTSPAGGATYTAPATIPLSATASDPDGSVTQVAFYAGSVLLGTDATSPFTLSWNNVPAGTYSLTAVASDNAGASTTSAAVTVQVVNPPQSTPFGETAPQSRGWSKRSFDEAERELPITISQRGILEQVSRDGCRHRVDVGCRRGYSLGYVAAGEWLKSRCRWRRRPATHSKPGWRHPGPGDLPRRGGRCRRDWSAARSEYGWLADVDVYRLAGIPLTAGPHVLRLVIDTNGALGWFGNVNYHAGPSPPQATRRLSCS